MHYIYRYIFGIRTRIDIELKRLSVEKNYKYSNKKNLTNYKLTIYIYIYITIVNHDINIIYTIVTFQTSRVYDITIK